MIDEQTEQMNSESLFLIFANIYYKEIYDKISEIIEDLNENSDDRKFLESVINESKNEKGSSYIKMVRIGSDFVRKIGEKRLEQLEIKIPEWIRIFQVVTFSVIVLRTRLLVPELRFEIVQYQYL